MSDGMRNRFPSSTQRPIPDMNRKPPAPISRFQNAQDPLQNLNPYTNYSTIFRTNTTNTNSPNSRFTPPLPNSLINEPSKHNSFPFQDQMPNLPQYRSIGVNSQFPVDLKPLHQHFTNPTLPGLRPNLNFSFNPEQPHLPNVPFTTTNLTPFHNSISQSRLSVPFSVKNITQNTFNVPPPCLLSLTSNPVTRFSQPSQPTHQLRFPPPLQSLSENANFTQNINSLPNFAVLPPILPNAFRQPPPSYPLEVSWSNGQQPQSIIRNQENSKPSDLTKENVLNSFLESISTEKKESLKKNITVAEFRFALRMSIILTKKLHECKNQITSKLHDSEGSWNDIMINICQLQDQLSAVSHVLTKENLSVIKKKLKGIKTKREYKKKRKDEASLRKIKKMSEREELNQEIDKWLECIKEKNLKLKREVEMKKEADNILSEVRRKIQEAKKTVEKIKVFEKLRLARQSNAEKKGLYVDQEHTANFEKKIMCLKETMLQQLSDYEAEERALRVMLETEQVGQLEEEALWRIRKMKLMQQKRQKNIIESLFGKKEEPPSDDPLFFFFQHQNSANTSIENLFQIRHQWDAYLSSEGDSIPQQWIVPAAPSNPTWENVCKDG